MSIYEEQLAKPARRGLRRRLWLKMLLGCLIVVAATGDTALPVVMTPTLTLVLFLLTLAMCVVSAIAAILQVTRIDPVTVFTR